MSEPETDNRPDEEPPDAQDVEPLPEVVPDDYLDQKPFDPAGR